MFIALHVVRTRDGKDVTDLEFINFDHVARFALCSDNSPANAYIYFQDQPTWTQIKVTESPNEIIDKLVLIRLTK